MSECDDTLLSEVPVVVSVDEVQLLVPTPVSAHGSGHESSEKGVDADCDIAVSLQYIESTLAAMAQVGLSHFAPTRFRFLEAMAKRAAKGQTGGHQRVLIKLAQSLSEFQNDFIQARRQAENQLRDIETRFPAATEEANAHFHRYRFGDLKKLQVALQLRSNRSASGLADLTQRLTQGLVESDAALNLEDSLLHQELQILNAVLAEAGIEAGNAARQAALELSSVRRFRESCVSIHSYDVVNKAIDERPENPGPLNPQMLTIRSLAMLRDISPQYLKRFVAYIDTMLWLEQSGAKREPAKKSKAR